MSSFKRTVGLAQKHPFLRVPTFSVIPRHFWKTERIEKRNYAIDIKERYADLQSNDPIIQANYLSYLNGQGRHQEVVSRYMSNQYANSDDTRTEYIKALERIGGLSSPAYSHSYNSNVNNQPSQQYQQQPQYANTPPMFQQQQPQPQFANNPFVQQQSAQAYGAPPPMGASYPQGYYPSDLGTSEHKPIFVRTTVPTQFGSVVAKYLSLAVIAILVWFYSDKILGGGASGNKKSLNPFSMVSEPKPIDKSDKKFVDVKGCEEAKGELREIVEYLKNPAKFTRLGGKLPKGVLLVGPPGTGKTLLAKAIAGEAGVPFFYQSGSEFEEMFVGVGARRVRELFEAARKRAPCIIFIDEIDAVGAKRNPKDQHYMRMTLNELLAQMDGFSSSQGIIIIGATNFPQSLDKALVRPGRFDRHITVSPPDVKGRTEIIDYYLENIPKTKNVDTNAIARGTPGFCGADLQNLVNIAAIRAALENKKEVSNEDLEYAKDRVLMGAERKSHVLSEESRKLTAYHEGGHAVVAYYTEGALPIHKATIMPRGQALGMVTQLPDKDLDNYTRKQLMAMLDVSMGGRVAEEIIFGTEEVTTGASSDFQNATRIAFEMVTRYGMSEKLGHMSYEVDPRNEMGQLSSETRMLIEAEVKILVESAYDRAKRLLTTHEKELHTVAKALLDKETLNSTEIKKLVGKDGANKTPAATPTPTPTTSSTPTTPEVTPLMRVASNNNSNTTTTTDSKK